MRIVIFHLVGVLSIYLRSSCESVCVCVREGDGENQWSIYLCAVFHRDLFVQLLHSFDWKWIGSNRIIVCFFFFILCDPENQWRTQNARCAFERKASIISFEIPLRTKLSITFVKLVGINDVKARFADDVDPHTIVGGDI